MYQSHEYGVAPAGAIFMIDNGLLAQCQKSAAREIISDHRYRIACGKIGESRRAEVAAGRAKAAQLGIAIP